ncbi:MAG TPA: potassium transporter [Helicobacteraceae bacterium]|nr:potassium transporter [Helicobacteraceae bacterium]
MDLILLYIVVALGVSTVLNIILKRFGISQIIGYIMTGTAMAYAFGIGHQDSHSLEVRGEFGIFVLMFTIGLEISLARLNKMKQIVFVNGAMQVGISALLFFVITHWIFKVDYASSVIIALALALSSTAVVLSYLKSSKEIHTTYGQRSMAILIFQDIAVIPILLLIGFMSSESTSVAEVLMRTFISAVVLIGLLFVVGRRVMTWLLKFSANTKLDELFMGSVLVIVMGASYLAHTAGFTYSLGAFVAGMIIAETRYHHKVESDIAPFKDLLLGTFFFTVGLKIDLAYFIEHVGLIFSLLVGILFLKTVIIYGVMQFTSKKQNSMKVALSLSQVGEFSFAIFALADSSNLIASDLMDILILVVVVSMILTPFLMTRIERIVNLLFPANIHEYDMEHVVHRKNHVVVCGYSIVGRLVADKLKENGTEYIAIDNSLKHVKQGLLRNEEIYYGDMSKSSILSALHVEDAAAVIVTVDNIEKKRLICETILKHTQNVNLIVKVISLSEKHVLRDLPIDVIVDSKVEVAHVLVEKTLSCNIEARKNL